MFRRAIGTIANNWNPVGVPNGSSATISNGGTCTIAAADGVVGGSTLNVGPGAINMTGGQLTYPNSGGIPLVETIGSSTGGYFDQSGGINIPYSAYSTTWGGWPLEIGAVQWNLRGVRPERRLGGRQRHLRRWSAGVKRCQWYWRLHANRRLRRRLRPDSQAIAIFVGGNGYTPPASAAALPKTPPTASTTFKVA